MRKFSGMRLVVAGGMMSAALALSSPAARAEEAATAFPPPVIAVVDVDAIMQESLASKGVQAQRDKYQQTYQDEISREEQSLRATKQDLEQQRGKVANEALAEKARAFDQSVAEFQRKVVVRRRALDRSFATAMGQIEQGMVDVTAQVAGDKGANVVLPRAQVILFADKMNITKDIVEALNKRLPSVEFPTPKLEDVGADAPAAGPSGGSPSAKKK